MKVIIDCNVLVSAGLNSQVCTAVLRYTLRETEVFFSPAIGNEYMEVLQRPKFSRQQTNMQKTLLAVYAGASLIVEVPASAKLSPDPKDQPYIDLAFAVQADYLITGNIQDFPDSPYGSTHIIKPADFLRLPGHLP